MPKVKMSEYLKSVTRGVQIKADVLKSMFSDDSDMRYLSPLYIENGKILYNDLPGINLNVIDGNINMKYMLRPRDIIICKSGTNIKASIASDNPGNIVVGDSLFILRVIPDTIDPVYIAAYLQSDEGKKQLQLSCKGNNISASSVKEMWIYVPGPDGQQDIVDKYLKGEKAFYNYMKYQKMIQDYFDDDMDYRS